MFLIGVISISAADVSAEVSTVTTVIGYYINCILDSALSQQAHAPYTALHTLSLLQLPIDLEVNVRSLS